MTRQQLLPKCVCGSDCSTGGETLGIPIQRCTECGVVRQCVLMSEEDLVAWYRDQYLTKAYYHSYEHDYAVAQLRLKAYGLTSGTRLLDVGCGNGAFVRAARDAGAEAWGQDLSSTSESEFVYVGALEDIAFPTDDFEVVTVHDVLEHLVRPLEALREIRRLLRRPGKLILDFPRFHHSDGKHHWKKVEHLWMFNEEQLTKLVQDAGFVVTAIKHPIPSKVVIEAEKSMEQRPQILVPPGIGDSWWSVTKIPGFLKMHGLGIPDVWVQDSGGPKRTHPFLRTIPFIHAAGYRQLSDRNPIFHEAYMQNRRTVFTGVAGTDYFIAYNGVLRFGRSLEEVDAEYGCVWRPKMHVSKEARKMQEKLTGPGPYILTYFAEAGMYRRWLSDIRPAQLAEALRQIRQATGLRIIFIGAAWDRGQVGRTIAEMDPSFEDLIGYTTFDQMLGAILGASGVVGFPAGNTMLATVFNVPTVLLWNHYFDERFWKYSCPPDAPYVPLNTSGLTPEIISRTFQDLLEKHGRHQPGSN